MITNSLFDSLSMDDIVKKIDSADNTICFVAPGLQTQIAEAIVRAAKRIGINKICVWIDCSESVLRMGYGTIEAIDSIRNAGIDIRHAEDVRSAIIITDNYGFAYTPTALFLEADPVNFKRNALAIRREQVAEIIARLLPEAKEYAVNLMAYEHDKERILALPAEENSVSIEKVDTEKIKKNIELMPPLKFDLERQVRVFSAYLQYVEIELTGIAVERKRVTIPAEIQKLAGSENLEGRLKTTFEIIETKGKYSSQKLQDELRHIREDFTVSLGKKHGRIIFKKAKLEFEKRIVDFKIKLELHLKELEKHLQTYINESKKELIELYLPIVKKNPPGCLSGKYVFCNEEDKARMWLQDKMNSVFPNASQIIKRCSLQVIYKDVTFEVLNDDDFIQKIKAAYPYIDWDKLYEDFMSARENEQSPNSEQYSIFDNEIE